MLNKICLRCGSPLQFSRLGMWICPNAANHRLSKLQEGRALKPIADKKYVAHQLSGLIEEYIRDCKKVGTDELNMAMIETTLGIFAKWLKEYK